MRDLRSRHLVLALLMAAPLLSGCAPSIASPSTSEAPVDVVAPSAPSNEDLAAYFAAVAEGDPAGLQDVAGRLTAPGSNAYAYAIEQAGAAQAYHDGGYPDVPSEMETTDDGFAVCSTNALTSERACNEFSNLVYVDGKLSDFDAGDLPLAGRITLGSDDLIPLGGVATARLIAAYRTISGSVDVVLEVKSSADGVSFGYGSSYQAPDGRQSDATVVVGPTELRAGSLGNYLLSFDGAAFGGSLLFVGHDSAFNEISAQIATTKAQ